MNHIHRLFFNFNFPNNRAHTFVPPPDIKHNNLNMCSKHVRFDFLDKIILGKYPRSHTFAFVQLIHIAVDDTNRRAYNILFCMHIEFFTFYHNNTIFTFTLSFDTPHYTSLKCVFESVYKKFPALSKK